MRRIKYSIAGIVACMAGMYACTVYIDNYEAKHATKLDGPGKPDDPIVVLGRERKVVIQKIGEEPKVVVDVVETGTSTVPTFPRILDYDEGGDGVGEVRDEKLVEYQLLGLGIRTVSFLSVQVYVMGMYIATEDIAKLQQALIRKIDPIASTLVAGETDQLKGMLYDATKGEEIWSSVLKESGCRTIVRIVPTRNADFSHLRDAWVRSITARATANQEEYGDDVFGASLGEFKALFSRGSIPKGKEMLLSRDKKGGMAIWYDDGNSQALKLGQVDDERISRALWLNYLAGKSVASEGARKSIVDGVMEFVARPVGTVAAQVHV